MARLQDDIARVWAWFRIQPKPARLALAGAGAGALALIYAYDAWPVLLVVVFGLLSRYGKKRSAPGANLPAADRAHHRAVRHAHRAAPAPAELRTATDPRTRRSNEPTAAEIQRVVAEAGRGVLRVLAARWEPRAPPPLPPHARPIVEDGGSLWRRRRSSSRGSIVE